MSFSPVPLIKGVEVIKGFRTSDETVNVILVFLDKNKKEPIFAKDSPGFYLTQEGRDFIQSEHNRNKST